MQTPSNNTRHSTALIRTIDGRINLLGCSGSFPFPQEALPADGSTCPVGTGLHEINHGVRKVFKGEVPVERWISPDCLAGRPCVLREHSMQLSGQILTMLEIETPVEE